MRRYITLLLLATSLIFAGNYKLPPKAILDVFETPQDEYISLITGTNKAIEYTYSRYKSLENLSQERLSLAGEIILPKIHSEINSYPELYLKLVNLDTGEKINLTPAEDNKIIQFKVSSDRKLVAYLAEKENGVYLRVVDLETGKMLFSDKKRVNMSLMRMAMEWSVDSKSLFLARILYDSQPAPVRSVEDISPRVQESYGKVSQLRTYTNLLETEFDMKLFDYYFTSQFVKLDISTGKEIKIAEPGFYRQFEESPDGNYFLIKKINKPYSFSVPYWKFGYTHSILGKDGKQVKELVTKGIQDQVPIGGVEKGLRYPNWIPTEDATIYWTEAQDEGDPKIKVPYRDYFYKVSSPFTERKDLFQKTRNRGYVSGFAEERGKYFYLDYDRENEWMKTYYASYNNEFEDKILFDRSENEKYEHPGQFVTAILPNGYKVIKLQNDNVFLYGQGYSPEGNFPFLNKFSLKTDKKEQLFKCADKSYENFKGFINNDINKICIRHESQTNPRNTFIIDLKTNARKQITNNIDHAPQVRNIKTELVTYLREDSLLLSGKLYLPFDYDPKKKYPLYISAYPREYTDPSTASQISGSQYTFTRFWGSSIKYLAMHGYVVLNGASMPVIGDIKTRNDTFVKQIDMNAKAAIDYLDSRGLIDKERVAVGGHSYGAFMTANLLAYTDYFKAGIAKSGAYNRTLTPFGFQSEERTYWEAKEFYQKASPFMNAEKIKTPLLLIHGSEDSISGTYPMQSERMYSAIQGNGGTVKLVMLPYEGHSYQAKESNLHVLAEICEWLDKYLKK